jgi:16S rRNA (cytidine1402-2'-O)-methyltransferase
MTRGILYLVPTGLGGEVVPLLPAATLNVVQRLDCFIAENPKSARAFLKAAGYPRPLQGIAMEILNEHTPQTAVSDLLRPLEAGTDCGLLSEAGCPAIADPGASLVRRAHSAGIRVVPLVGPSALLLALMASGLNGQRFAFHGYLPVERTARAKRLADLERESEKTDVAQVFIETPYRNEAMLEAILATCHADTLLCIATDLTLSTESIRTRPVAAWKSDRPQLDKRPTVFLLYRDKTQSVRKR